LEETSTCRYTLSELKLYERVSGYPFAVSPMFTVNTPSRTVAVAVPGAEVGQTRLPLDTASHKENLK
jgi:hypothetical protein